MRKKFTFNYLFFFLLLGIGVFATITARQGQAGVSEGALVSEEDPLEDANLIRQARLTEMLDRQIHEGTLARSLERGSLEPDTTSVVPSPGAQSNCKYESGIGTPPPYMKVALTFDDGPSANGTPYILQVLQKYHLHATFFMIGESAAAHPDLVRRVAAAGHLIVGNHSWTHPDFHNISVQEQANEVNQNITLLSRYETPKFFRYPYGDATCETNNLVHTKGYKIVGWHVDSCDWAFNATGAVGETDANICEVAPQNRNNFQRHVVSALLKRKGGILLMHEIQPHTIKQLDSIIEQLLHEGFTFGTIDEPDFQPSLR